jgi:hypothetical protein
MGVGLCKPIASEAAYISKNYNERIDSLFADQTKIKTKRRSLDNPARSGLYITLPGGRLVLTKRARQTQSYARSKSDAYFGLTSMAVVQWAVHFTTALFRTTSLTLTDMLSGNTETGPSPKTGAQDRGPFRGM